MGTMKMILILKHFDFLVCKTFSFRIVSFQLFVLVFLNSSNPTPIFLTITLDK